MLIDSKVVLSQLMVVIACSAFALQANGAGALAIDGHQGGQYGFTYNLNSMVQAEQKALQECGDGCQVVLRFETGCAAFAVDQSNAPKAYGWGALNTASDSQTRAMAACKMRGGKSCKVQSSGCNKS